MFDFLEREKISKVQDLTLFSGKIFSVKESNDYIEVTEGNSGFGGRSYLISYCCDKGVSLGVEINKDFSYSRVFLKSCDFILDERIAKDGFGNTYQARIFYSSDFKQIKETLLGIILEQ